jgi:hypothetical protein
MCICLDSGADQTFVKRMEEKSRQHCRTAALNIEEKRERHCPIECKKFGLAWKLCWKSDGFAARNDVEFTIAVELAGFS